MGPKGSQLGLLFDKQEVINIMKDDINIDIAGHCIVALGWYYKTNQRSPH
jgi:hypothetical protein